MLGHVAENIIQHTNAILDDPSLQVEHIKNSLGGGDEQSVPSFLHCEARFRGACDLTVLVPTPFRLLGQACEWGPSCAFSLAGKQGSFGLICNVIGDSAKPGHHFPE